METNVKERLMQYLKQKGISKNKFETSVGLGQGYLNKLRHEPSPTKLRSIIQTYPDLSEKWLLTGEGDMLASNDVTPVIDARHSRIPLVSQYAQAGYLTGYADEEYVAQLPTIDFTPDREMTGNYLAFEVRGDSMDDGSKQAYVEGEIVICREVEPYLYKENKLHIAKRDFVIVHQEGILLKRIIDHDLQSHTITIHSLNPEYPDRTLDLSHVFKIFSVIESRMQRRR